jgi:regulator of sigma E protease
MQTSDAIEGKSEGNVPPAPPLSRILVALAGPVMNVALAFLVAVIIWIFGLPVLIDPSIIGYVEPGSVEAKLGVKAGDRIVAVDGKQVRSWLDVQMFTKLARSTNSVQVKLERDGVVTPYELPLTNNLEFGLKLLNLTPKDHPIVAQVVPGSPAEKAGLLADDEFSTFAGVPVLAQSQLVDLIHLRPEKPSEVEVLRGGKVQKLTVTPRLDPDTKTGLIGVHLSPSRQTVYRVQKPGPTPVESFSKVLGTLRDTVGALVHSKQTGVSAKDMSGPVGIFGVLAIQAKTDFRLALYFMIVVNLNLAILNLMPIPVLDGGHIVIALYEWVTRRRLATRLVEALTMTFAVLLISFMLYVTFFDLTRRGPIIRNLLKQESVVESATPEGSK